MCIQTANRRSTNCKIHWRFKLNHLTVIGILINALSRFSSNFCEKRNNFFTFSYLIKDDFFNAYKIDQKVWEVILEKAATYTSIHFRLLFLTVRNKVLCLRPIKNYSKTTHRFFEMSINITGTFHNKKVLVEILLLWY
jgi:hypothetical protein